MSQPTSGMKLQQDRITQSILELQGDLFAIAIIRDRSMRSDVAFPARKHLWNAQSRLISRITTSLGITNVNSLESALARELVGLASKAS